MPPATNLGPGAGFGPRHHRLGPDGGDYAVAGLAIGDLIPEAGDPQDELVVTTLDGDLFVYSLTSTGIDPNPVSRTAVPGSLGAFDSIVIADLESTGVAQLYVAGSMGIWKWTVNVPGGN